jgi:hypothetical protein
MDIGREIWLKGVSAETAEGQWAAAYFFVDLSRRPPLVALFDALSARVQRCMAEELASFGQNTVWAVVVFGLDRDENDQVLQAKQEFMATCNRHPDVWGSKAAARTSLWFVDRANVPYEAIISPRRGQADQAVIFSPDVRQTDFYRQRLEEDIVDWGLTLRAVQPELLAGSREFKRRSDLARAEAPQGERAEPGATADGGGM